MRQNSAPKQVWSANMPIAREGRFLRNHESIDRSSLGLESAILSDCVSEILAKRIKGVFGSSVWGFHEKTLDALAELSEIERVSFWDVDLVNIDALYRLPRLREFAVTSSRPAVDFSKFPNLIAITWVHQLKDCGIDALRELERLHIWHYRPKSKSFSNLVLPPNLRELTINWANPSSLDGLSAIPTLRRLEIHRCRNLANLASLPVLFPKLEYLVVTTCGRMAAGEGERIAACLPNLKHAFVQDTKLV